jgi:hypothetical protein
MMQIDIDPIGTLYADPVGEAAPLPLPGYHVNATHAVPGWSAWRVTPATPRRVFAGVPTVFYTFASQQDFATAMETAVLSVPTAPTVPASVTARQAHQALIVMGLYDQVAPAINAIADATQRRLVQAEWDKSQVFERNRPALIALATGALGMTEQQLDDLFVFAATL